MLGWLAERPLLVRSGPDGADLELLDVLSHVNISRRVSQIVIGYCDGVFADAAASMAKASGAAATR